MVKPQFCLLLSEGVFCEGLFKVFKTVAVAVQFLPKPHGILSKAYGILGKAFEILPKTYGILPETYRILPNTAKHCQFSACPA
jgi:hypothetical protein